MSLIPDVATIPYDNSFDILKALDKDNVNRFALLNNNQEVNAEPMDVENLNGKYYFFLNENNIVEYIGNEPTEEEIFVEDDMENIDIDNSIIVHEGFMNLNNSEDLMLIIILILLLIFVLC